MDKMPEGFFSLEKMEGMAPKFPQRHCPCKLAGSCKTRMMKPKGKGRSNILIVGEAPNQDGDERGIPFGSLVGARLRDTLERMDCYLDDDCVQINAVNCCPPDNRPPTDQEIDTCRERVFRTIKEVKPRVILLLGAAAMKSVILPHWKGSIREVDTWRGYQIPCPKLEAYLCPTYHPSFVIDNKGGATDLFFFKDLKAAFRKHLEPGPQPLKIEVETYSNPTKAAWVLRGWMDELKEDSRVAFDYETTGLKPHAKGHRVVCMSVSNGKRTLAFRYGPVMREVWIAFLKSKLRKIASNKKFEETWSRIFFQTRVKNWYHDTMLAAHVLDNRPGITSIKFQAFIRYGLGNYDSHISPYLQSGDKNANAFNRIDQIEDSNELLKYCGYDSFLEWKTAKDQRHEILPKD